MATDVAALVARCDYHLRCGWASLPQPQPGGGGGGGGSAPYGFKIVEAHYSMTGVAVLRIMFLLQGCRESILVVVRQVTPQPQVELDHHGGELQKAFGSFHCSYWVLCTL
ncbi:hypothetical protein VPH35_127900 [Triticum aestivum]